MTALHRAVQDATAGDPVSGLRWTHKTTRRLARALRQQGFPVSHTTVARLLRQAGYSLRTNRKSLARTQDPDRDQQFRLIARQRRRFLRCGWPVLSLDTKKKELVGNFKNPGTCWRRQALPVLDHDFASDAAGRAIPYGIYDEGWDDGYVVVGTSRETPEFAVAAVRHWWQRVGRWRYPATPRLLLEVDCGGGQRQPGLGLEGSAAAPGRRVAPDHHGAPLPAGGVEVEPRRTPAVQPDQRQLGRPAAGELRDDLELHPHHANRQRPLLRCRAGYGRIPPGEGDGGTKSAGPTDAASDTPQVELHDSATANVIKLFLYGALGRWRARGGSR